MDEASLPHEDRRRHLRREIELAVRVVLPGGREARGQLCDVSAGGARVRLRAAGVSLGDRIALYVDRLGRIEGSVARLESEGFAVSFSRRSARLKRLADSLTWIVNCPPERDRRGARRFAKDEPARIELSCGRKLACRILDVSTTGASIGMAEEERPAIGTEVAVGVMRARVVRHHAEGVGVAFLRDA